MEERTPAGSKKDWKAFFWDKLRGLGRELKSLFVYFPAAQGCIWLFTLFFTLMLGELFSESIYDVLEKGPSFSGFLWDWLLFCGSCVPEDGKAAA